MASELALSVILTTSKDVRTTSSYLLALGGQTLPADRFEVIVLGSRNRELNLREADFPYRLRSLPNGDSGDLARARNSGLSAAVGRYCLFLSLDGLPDGHLFSAHLKVQEAYGGAVGIGGQSGQAEGGDLPGEIAPLRLQDCTCDNLSAPRSAMLAAGGFDVGLPASVGWGLCYRLVEAGLPLASVAADICRTGARESAPSRAARAAREGAAAVALWRGHPALLSRLRLGHFNDGNLRSRLLRRLLLRLHVPARLLARILQGLITIRGPSDRAEQFLYEFGYWCGVQRALAGGDDWERLTESPVVLMYHAVGDEAEKPGTYVIPRRGFARQMAWLKHRRRPVIPLEALLMDRRAGLLPPARSVVITFDDGYRDNRELAGPILARCRFPATIFVVTRYAGDANRWDLHGELAGRPLLSWVDMQAMQAGGTTFGAHTGTHPHLTKVGTQQMRAEVTGSRADVERELASPCLAFAYPHGDFNAEIELAVAEAGYLGACCSVADVNDPAEPIYALRRVEIRGTDSFARFILAVWLGRRISVWQLLTRLVTGG